MQTFFNLRITKKGTKMAFFYEEYQRVDFF